MAQNNKRKVTDVHRTTSPFLRCLPGHCKAKDRPQFGLKCAKLKKKQQQ